MGPRSFGAVGEVRAFVGAAGRVAAWKGALVGLGRGGVRLGAWLALREVLGEAVNAVKRFVDHECYSGCREKVGRCLNSVVVSDVSMMLMMLR